MYRTLRWNMHYFARNFQMEFCQPNFVILGTCSLLAIYSLICEAQSGRIFSASVAILHQRSLMSFIE